MSMPSYAVLALIPAIAWLLYMQVSQWRFKRFAHIPSPLSSNLLFGHLGHIAAEYKKAGSSTVHPDYVLENIWKAHGSPGYMFFDTRPVQYPLLLIASHEMAEQVSRSSKTQQYSVTKSPTVQQGFGELVGRYSLISENGESWKGLRKTFNPGFAPQHLLSLLPVMIDKTYTLMEKLDALADSGVAAEMEPYCTNVTFDIIGEVVTNIDCKAQDGDEQAHDIVRNFKALKALYASENGGLSAAFLDVVKRVKKIIYSRRLDSAVKKCIVEKFASIKAAQNASTKDTKDRSVLALALQDTDELTPFLLQSTADQVKSFLFAGHDTTAILLQRLLYALSIHPGCLEKIRAEHDAIFGSTEPRAVFLARPDETMKALKYTSACIKETLRLWPPAGSARMSHNGFKLTTPDGDAVLVDDCVLYLCHHIIQRDPTVYGETADDFDPARWVGDADTSTAATDAPPASVGDGRVPVSAWRAFERGPRNCIGQELANMEARVILACLVRRYDFVKVGRGEVDVDDMGRRVIDDKGRYKTKSELINTMSITSRPIDRTVMRVEYRDRGEGGW